MATFASQYYGNRYIKLTITEDTAKADPVNNRTYYSWKVEVLGYNGYHWVSASVLLKIDGTTLLNTTFNSKPSGVFPETDDSPNNVKSGNMWIYHDSDGTKKIDVTFDVALYYRAAESHGGSFNARTLDRAAPTVTYTQTSEIGTASFKAAASSSVQCSRWAHRIKQKGGSYGSWVYADEDSTAHTFTVTGLQLNTDYVIQLAGMKKTNGVWGYTSEVSVKTLGYSTIDSAANVTLSADQLTAVDIRWTPLDKNFKFKVAVSIEKWSTTSDFIYAGSLAQISYKKNILPLEDIARNCVGSRTATMVATVITYTADGTRIGSSARIFRAAIPQAAVAMTAEVRLAPSSESGFSVYTKTRSYICADVNVATKYGALVRSASMTVEGRQVIAPLISRTGTDTYAIRLESDFLRTHGNLTVSIVIMDSRGATVTLTRTITVYDYFLPSLSAEIQTAGDIITIKYDALVAAVNNLNAKKLSIEVIKAADGSVVGKYSGTLPAYKYTGTYQVTVAGASTEVYQATLVLTDSIVSSDPTVLKTGVVLISGLPEAKGVSFFEKATREGFWIRNIRHEITDLDMVEIAWQIATEWSSAEIYHAGQFVTRSMDLYQRITDMGTPESWRAADWKIIGYYVNGEYSSAGEDMEIAVLIKEMAWWISRHQQMEDFEVEALTLDGWEVERKKSGKVILRKTVNLGKPSLTAYGSGYYSTQTVSLPAGYPSQIKRVRKITCRSQTGLWNASVRDYSTSAIAFYLYNTRSETPGNDVYADLEV